MYSYEINQLVIIEKKKTYQNWKKNHIIIDIDNNIKTKMKFKRKKRFKNIRRHIFYGLKTSKDTFSIVK